MEKIVMASDHAGFELKSILAEYAKEKGFEVEDLGPYNNTSVDYPDYAYSLVKQMRADKDTKGILVCGSGIGMSMAANRFSFIRGALVRTTEDAELCRKHNNANLLILGGRVTSVTDAKEIFDTFFSTEFEGGRHERRVNKLGEFGTNEKEAEKAIKEFFEKIKEM